MRHFLLICIFAIISTSAAAHCCCFVEGRPLNVRSQPNGGTILGAHRHGTAVRITQRYFDQRGRPWVFILPQAGWAGWVYPESLSGLC
jgi:hypothetical protein